MPLIHLTFIGFFCALGHIATEKMTVLQYYHLLKRLYE